MSPHSADHTDFYSMRMCPTCGVRFTTEAAFCPHDGSPTQVVGAETESIDPLIGQVLDGLHAVLAERDEHLSPRALKVKKDVQAASAQA